MRLSRRSLSVAGFSLVGLAVVFAACTNDSTAPLGPEPPGVAPPVTFDLGVVECRADLSTRGVSCGDPDSPDGVSRLIVGGQNVYVRLSTTNQAVLGTDTLAFDLTVQNLLRQPVDGRKQNFGTNDGTTLDPAGVRVFFHQDPVPNAGTVTVVNPTGSGIFTGSNQEYYQYDQVLDSGVVSAPYPERWKLHFQGGATSATWLLLVAAEVPLDSGWVDILPESTTVYVDSSATVTATVRSFVGNAIGGSVTFSSNNPAIASINPTTGVITGEGLGQTTITATSGPRTGTAVVIVPSEPPVVNPDSISGLANVTVPVDSANGLLPNVVDTESDASIVPGTFTTAEGGIARIAANGSYDYLNAPGFTGKDTILYDVADGDNTVQGYVVVQVEASNYYYVKQGASGTTDGRDRFPFASLADAQAVAGSGDSIFVLYAGATQLDGPLVMEAGQALIGQGITGDIVRTLNTLPVTVLADSSAPGVTRTSAGATVTLASGNTIAGIGLASGNGAAIAGTSFGTLTTHSITVGATGGPALDLTTGTLSGTFTTLSSTNSSTRGVHLSGVSGSLNATGGAISGAAGAAVEVVGGTVTVSYGGNVTQGNSAALVSVSGGHATGTLTFTGTLSATAGTGLQFNDADGTYNFNGTTTLNGGDAGVDITNGSAGNFGFASGAAITSPSGTAFAVNGSAPSVVYSGGITKGNAGLLVDVSSQTGGTVTFQTGTLQATAGTGIQLNDADGTVNFTGTTTLGGGNAGIDVMGGSGGTITFGTNSSISNTSGVGLHVLNSAPNLSYGGSVAQNASSGSPVTIDGASSCGTISLTGNINSQNLGIVVQDCGNAATNITFSGGNKTLNTGANAAVTLTNNALGAINFTGGGLGITTTTGAGFTASGGGTVQVTGAGNSVATGTGTALSLNGMTLHANGMNWGSGVSASGAANGVSLTNVTSGGTITGTGGTITGGAGAAFLVSGGSVSATFTSNISQGNATHALVSVAGGHSGTLTFGTGTLSATNGTGLQFDNADGVYNFNGTTTLNGGDAGIDMLAGSDGDFVFGTGVAITNPSGTGVFVSASSPDVTYSGSISKNSAGWLVDIFDTATGTITFQTGNLSATGTSTGITFNDADATVNFSGPSTALSGGTARINMQGGSSGAITFNSNTSVAGPTGGLGALHVTNGGNATNLSYAGSLTANAAGRPAHIEGVSGGTVTVSGSITSSGGQGLLLQSNAGGTITFSGSTKTFNTGANAAVTSTGTGASVVFSGGNLDIDATSGKGFTFTAGGTVTVTGSNNTISTGTGIALEVQNTNIGASGLTFVSISHSGGANGILLSTTGNSNGLQVTGTGTNGSGGTITNTTGGDGAVGGNGIYVNSARNIILNWMALSGHANNGLLATSVTNLTVDKLRFTGNNGSSNSGTFEESAVHLVNSGGAIKITNSRMDGGAWNGFTHRNTSAVTVDSLVLAFDTVSTMQGSLVDGRNTGLQALFYAGTADVRFRNNSVTFWWGNAIQVVAEDASAVTARLLNNVASQTSGAQAGAGGIHVTGGNLQYLISGNNVQGANGTAISADKQDFTTHMRGTIDGNTIGTSGVTNSGSGTGIAIFASHVGPNVTTTRISNNVIRQIAGSANGAVTVLIGDDVGGGGAGTMNATVTGNNIQETGTPANSAQQGMLFTIGRVGGDTDVACLDIGGAGGLVNTITNFAPAPATPNRIRVNERFLTTARFPGYTGANNDNTALQNYLAARNSASNYLAANNVSAGGAGFLNTVPPGSACTQPPAL